MFSLTASYLPAAIPSPSHGVWNLGPIPIRAYALIILAGIAVAIYLGEKRWIERGGSKEQVMDVAMWAVPMGVIGGRIYHVLTDWGSYFSDNGKGFLAALKIWEGGLGIWGAIALGGVGVYIAAAKYNLSFLPLADALAPGIVIAQGIGRWGNWANQELFGKPTTLPWGLSIDAVHRPVGFEEFSTFQPTFLYESLACFAIAYILIWADKKFTLGHGRVFALYVALYCSARGAIETLRIDEAHHILGIRLNVFTALIIGTAALIYLVLSGERYYGREELVDGRVLSARARRDRVQPAQPVSVEVQEVDPETEVELEQADTDFDVVAAQLPEHVAVADEYEEISHQEIEMSDNSPIIEEVPETATQESLTEEPAREDSTTQDSAPKERGRRRKR